MRKARNEALSIDDHRVFPLLDGEPRRILIASDTFEQINGCAHTLRQTAEVLGEHGHDVRVVAPEDFRVIPNPVYPDVPLALPDGRYFTGAVRGFRPHSVHVATEGPVGIVARRECLRNGWRFTSSFHTLWPEMLTWRALEWFHRESAKVMVSTGFMTQALLERGLDRLARWNRGIDLSLFRPRPRTLRRELWPIALYVGRLSVEKNVEAFLELDFPGTKYVVGDGPARGMLERRFSSEIRKGRLVFLGFLRGERLAEAYANAHVFVFPSRTDTFGIVLLEALASGVPVAAYPVGAAPELVNDEHLGALDEDLGVAVRRALQHGDPARCRQRAASYTWEGATEEFLRNLVPANLSWWRRPGRRHGHTSARLTGRTSAIAVGVAAFAHGRAVPGRSATPRDPKSVGSKFARTPAARPRSEIPPESFRLG